MLQARSREDEMLRDARRTTRVVTLLFDLLRTRGPMTRSQLQRVLRASPVTVTAAVHELIARGFAHERDEGVPTGGRRARLVDLGPTLGGVLAADIGSIKLRVASANLRGEIVVQETIETPRSPSSPELASLFVDIASALNGPVRAIGLGVAGAVLPDGQLSIAPTLPEWQRVDFEALFAPFDAPVLIDNESNLAGLGEYHKGGHHGIRDLLFVAVGAGIGSALILDGRLHRGATGRAGEIGDLKTSLDDSHELERDAGAVAIVERYRSGGGTCADADAKLVFELAAVGDAAATSAVREAIEKLALALVNASSLLDPARIVIGGGLAAAGDALLEPIRELMRPHLHELPEVVPSTLGSDATLHGGIEWALETAVLQLLAEINMT
jgi:predicted NBD/HSP70 family sugar kinase